MGGEKGSTVRDARHWVCLRLLLLLLLWVFYYTLAGLLCGRGLVVSNFRLGNLSLLYSGQDTGKWGRFVRVKWAGVVGAKSCWGIAGTTDQANSWWVTYGIGLYGFLHHGMSTLWYLVIARTARFVVWSLVVILAVACWLVSVPTFGRVVLIRHGPHIYLLLLVVADGTVDLLWLVLGLILLLLLLNRLLDWALVFRLRAEWIGKRGKRGQHRKQGPAKALVWSLVGTLSTLNLNCGALILKSGRI